LRKRSKAPSPARAAGRKGKGRRGRAGTVKAGLEMPREAALVEKYRVLTEKYQALVSRLEKQAQWNTASVRLAVAARQSGSTAIALLDSMGNILSRNPHWNALEGKNSSGWRYHHQGRNGGDEVAYTLAEVTAREARTIQAHGSTDRPQIISQAGTQRFVELRLGAFRYEKDNLLMAVAHDVSSRIAAESELAQVREKMFEQQRLQAVGELASGIAHDLNNALHAMVMRLTRLMQSAPLTEEDRANVEALIRLATDTAVRIGRLQELGRRRADAPKESVDLAKLIREVVAVARPELEERSTLRARPITVETELSRLPPIVGASAELRHVFLNLLMNARDAMPDGGRVTVRARHSGRQVVVTVEDEGVGIPAGNLSRIFDPFYTTKGSRGTGLGLSIAHGVMRRLGGSIAAANRPGGGAVMTLRFPFARGSAAARPAEPAPAPPVKCRVLVVDDDADTLEATSWVLQDLGQAVEVAPSGPEAIRRFEAGERFDVVLCDIGMPGMNGWEVAERIGSIAPGTRILMLSGWALEIAPGDTRRRLVAGVLAKPISVEDLRKAIAPPRPVPEGPAAAADPPAS
jgi:signal transduction histidine kinase/ActR/RegA family two-component response regulator